MKIISLTTYIVPPRWLFLKIETDAGVTGWGEPVVEVLVGCVCGAFRVVGALAEHRERRAHAVEEVAAR